MTIHRSQCGCIASQPEPEMPTYREDLRDAEKSRIMDRWWPEYEAWERHWKFELKCHESETGHSA